MLFATLETSVRHIKVSGNKSFLLSDTVGFVSDLPHNLVKAFRSTLEEVCEADLLIHVVDISNPHYEAQIDVTKETLKQIGADHIPVIYAYNKIDLVDETLEHKEGIYISAKKNRGIEKLINLICDEVFTDRIQCTMLIPYEDVKAVPYFNQNANVLDTAYVNEGTVLNMECTQMDFYKYKKYVITQ